MNNGSIVIKLVRTPLWLHEQGENEAAKTEVVCAHDPVSSLAIGITRVSSESHTRQMYSSHLCCAVLVHAPRRMQIHNCDDGKEANKQESR